MRGRGLVDRNPSFSVVWTWRVGEGSRAPAQRRRVQVRLTQPRRRVGGPGPQPTPPPRGGAERGPAALTWTGRVPGRRVVAGQLRSENATRGWRALGGPRGG